MVFGIYVKLLGILILISIVCISWANSYSYHCDKRTRLYESATLLKAFKNNHRGQSQKQEQTYLIDSVVGIQCIADVIYTRNGKDYFAKIDVLTINNPLFEYVNNERKRDGRSRSKTQKQVEESKKIAGIFDKVTIVVTSKNGKILHVLGSKKEQPFATSIKSSIINQLQSMFHGDHRVEETPNGMSKDKYYKDELPNKTIIKKVTKSKHMRKKNGKEKGVSNDSREETENTYDLKGDLIESISTGVSLLGKDKSRSDTNNVRQQGGQRDADAFGDVFNFEYESRLKYKTSKKIKVDIPNVREKLREMGLKIVNRKNLKKKDSLFTKAKKQQIKRQEKSYDDEAGTLAFKNTLNEFGTSLNEELSTEDHFEEKTLGVSKALEDYMSDIRKGDLKKSINLARVLHSLKNDPDDSTTLSQALTYSHHFPKESSDLALSLFDEHVKPYSRSKSIDDKKLNYGKVLQTVIAAGQDEYSQNALTKTLTSIPLAHHFTLKTLELNNPTHKVYSVVKRMAKSTHVSKNPKLNDDILDLKDNAYLISYTLAGKMSTKHRENAFEELSSNLLSSSHSIQDFHHQLRAVHNLGSTYPLRSLKQFILSTGVPLKTRILSIEALANRLNVEESGDVNTLINHIVESDDFHSEEKTAAVMAQIERSRDVDTEESDQTFAQALFDPKSGVSLQNALNHYFGESTKSSSESLLKKSATVNSHSSVYTLSDKIDSFHTEAKVLGRFLKKVGRAVKKVAKKTNKVVKKVAKKVEKGIKEAVSAVKNIANIAKKIENAIKNVKSNFAKAKFIGSKKCVKANSKGDSICVYDNDMYNFVRKQGVISHMKFSKQFVFERLVGVEAIHLYVGAVAYAGSNIVCEGPNRGLSAVLFGRAHAKYTLFGKKGNVITLELELQKRRSTPLHDRAHVRFFKTMVLERRFVPEKVRKHIDKCEKITKPLFKKNYPNIVRSTQVFVVVVPITLEFSLSGNLGVDAVLDYCPFELRLGFSIEPYFGLTGSGFAGVTILIAKAGLSADVEFKYRLIPKVGVEGCSLCARLDQNIIPIKLSVKLSASALNFEESFQIAEIEAKPIKTTFFKECIRIIPKGLTSEDHGEDFSESASHPPIKSTRSSSKNSREDKKESGVAKKKIKKLKKKIKKLEKKVKRIKI